MADDLVAGSAPTANARAKLLGDTHGHVMEVVPGGLEQGEPPLEVLRWQHLALDLGRHVRDAPEVGRAGSGDSLDDLIGPERLKAVERPARSATAA